MVTGGTDDDGAMPPESWPPPSLPLGPGAAPETPHAPNRPDTPPPPPSGSTPPPMIPAPSVGLNRLHTPSPKTWKRPPLGAPLGVWIGAGLFLAVPVLVIVALVMLIEPTSDAGFMTFEDDETGFFPFLGSLVSIMLLIVVVGAVGIALLLIAVLVMVVSGFARRKPR